MVELGTSALMECPACDGVWIEADVFERLCADREAQAAVLHRFAGGSQPVEAKRVQYRPCVQCGKMMNRVNAGELHQIVEFIHAGGLERARERQLEELREQERRLAERERQASRNRGAADAHEALGLHHGQLSGGKLLDLINMMRRNS